MINSQGPSVEHYHHYPCWPPPRATYRETRASSSARRSCISVCSAMNRFRSARSEEHTYELQSLMRTSYAVFCLKIKKHHYFYYFFFLMRRPQPGPTRPDPLFP